MHQHKNSEFFTKGIENIPSPCLYIIIIILIATSFPPTKASFSLALERNEPVYGVWLRNKWKIKGETSRLI